jgi:RHS repeat-associated protein
MKQFYLSILFLSFSFFISAQTTPTGSSAEVGTTEGQLTVSLAGNANYTVPIAVPPGINGVEPQIGLSYNSQKGFTGTATVGWDISGVSSITRIPSTTFHDGTIDPVDFDALDRFALNGQRLIKKNSSQTYGADGTVYETESYSNIRVTSYGIHPSGANYGPAYFLVEYPDGSKEFYGNSTDSRSVTDWSITYWENAQGVRISYNYSLSNNSLILESVKYGARGTSNPINEVQFTYGVRSNPENYYIGGTQIKRDKNLTGIKVIGNGIGYRNYSLTVQDKITSITEKNGDNTKSYNPTLFEYDSSMDGIIKYLPLSTTLSVGNINSLNAGTVSGDFNEDGRMDFLLYPTTGADAKRKFWLFYDIETGSGTNMGTSYDIGAFDDIFSSTFLSSDGKVMPQGWTTVQGSTFTTYAKSSLGVYQQYQKIYTFPRFILNYYYQCDGFTSTQPQIQSFSEPTDPPSGPTDPPPGGGGTLAHYESNIPRFFTSGDFNGDGLTDIVAIEKSFTYPYTIGCTTVTSTYAGGRTIFINLDRRLTSNFANISSSLLTTNNSKIMVADFNGDGKSDIFVFDTGIVKIYSLNDSKQFVLLTQLADTGIDITKPILMGDYNGDGKSEFMIPKAYASVTWIRYVSTGISLLKEEKNLNEVFQANDSYNTYNYIAADYDNDDKADLIETRNFRNQANTSGSISVRCVSTLTGGAIDASTGDQSDINIYALPLYLPQTLKSIQSGVNKLSPTLQIALVNQNKIHFFTCDIDAKKQKLLKKITTGNGVQEMISYVPLDSKYSGLYPYNQIYSPTTSWLASYPNLDIKINPNLYVVSKIEKQSKDVYRKKLFSYYGAVTNLDGLGFIGFRSVNQTDWHDDSTTIFSNLFNNDIDLRGANVESFTVPYMVYPSGGTSPSDYVSKSLTTYETTVSPLQANKVFKLKTLNVKQSSAITNTNGETTDIQYDTNKNVTFSRTYITEGSSLAKTVTTTTAYQSVASPYIIGRPSSKSVSVLADGHTMTNNESYTYDGNQLLANTDRSAIGTSTISESNLYDANGNVTKKTITSQVPAQSRSSLYEYDPSGRYVTKITDNDNLISTFDYNWENGSLKKETNPYGSSSYTYDTWFKRLTAKDDWLNKTTSFTYTKNAEKTIATTTPDPLDGGASEEIFDDLGRKIRSGSKDINGTFSYVSYLYDIFDRNYKVSEPYFGSSPFQWNETKFDIYSRPTQSILFNNRSVSTGYSGLLTTTTDGSKTKILTRDAAGNVTKTNETLGGDITYKYFANGNLKQSNYNGINIDIEQDGWGRKTKVIDPSAGTFIYTNNDYGELTQETSQNGNVITTITRDPSGRPTKKTIVGSGTNSETNYTYDATKLPLTITYIDNNEPLGTNTIVTTMTYDNTFKRVLSIEENKIGVSKFTTSFEYDGLGRIVTETKLAEIGGQSSSVVTKNEYKNGDLYRILDVNNKVLWQTNTLNAKGQVLESVTGNGIKMTNTYDNDGYLSTTQHDKITTPTGNILTLTTAFNKNTDNLDSRINNVFGNYTEAFHYDEIDRLKKFTNKLGIEEDQTYDASGKITSNSLGLYDYDPVKKYQNIAVTLTPEATAYYVNRQGIFNDGMEDKNGWGPSAYPNSSFYTYDETKSYTGKTSLKLTNSTLIEQYVHSDKWIAIDNGEDTEYTYSAWVYSDGPQAELALFMKTPAETGYYTNVISVFTSVTNQWTKIEGTFLVPSYIKKLNIRLDNNGFGNMWYDDVQIRKTSDPVSTERKLNVTYNAFKSPIQIEETGVTKLSFTYNDDNQRSTMYYGSFDDKLLRPLRKHYSADGTMEIKENRATGTFEFVTYIGGDGYSAPIAVKSNGSTQNYLYLHRDYQGSILAITDDNANVVERRLFDAWGSIIKVQDGAGNVLNGLTILDRGYTGHEYLQSVGLINMNARLYDPILHRFLQADNYIQDPTSTQNYNQYGYVLNNPLLYRDTSGDICEGCSGGPGVNNGGGTGISTDLSEFGRDTGITQWAKRNLNFNSWGNSWNSFWGKNGNDDPKPHPNLSRYATISNNQYSTIKPFELKNSNGLTTKQWEKLSYWNKQFEDKPGQLGGSGGLGFISGGGAIEFVQYSGESLNLLKSTELFNGLAQNETAIAEIIAKMKAGDPYIYKEPVYIYLYEGEKYILNGHHRVEAAIRSGQTLEAIELAGMEISEHFTINLLKIKEIWAGMHF